ncbi:hypothetical protein BVY04_00160 [bacterium M21]|nr:hypothetical protein BVY04_00160 [bacterium M21]
MLKKLLFVFTFLLVSSLWAKRPNIIFLQADDFRASGLSCQGNKIAKTVNLDKLAEQGVRFSNAYTVAPVCQPSRVSFLLGQYQRTHGVGFSTKKSLSEAQWDVSYPARLRDAGYYTGFIGKFGVERYDFKGKANEKFDYWMAHDGWSKFFPKEHKNTAIYKEKKSDIITEIMGESMEQFLDTRPADKPFCLSVSFSAPHGSTSTTMCKDGGWLMNKPANLSPLIKDHPVYGSLYRNLDIPLPETMDGHPEQYLPRDVMNPEHGRNKCYAYNYTRERVKEHLYRYNQLIKGVDNQVGRLLEALKEQGLADNTIIAFSSDNGLLIGDYNHGGKGLLYDLTAKVPFILYDPRLPEERRGQVVDVPILSIDLAPTILSYAGVDIPKEMEGEQLQPVMENVETGRKEVFLESLFALRGNAYSEGVRSGKFKYIRHFRTPGQLKAMEKGRFGYGCKVEEIQFESPTIHEQLFDLNVDPGETVNLVNNPEYKAVLTKLRKRCKEESLDLKGE